MALFAVCMPILPGKKEQWLQKMDEIRQEPGRTFSDNREKQQGYTNSFLQETPQGDFVILTFEGDDPAAGFGQIMANMPPDFAEFAKEVHGLDAGAPPPNISLIVDTWD